MAAGSSASPGGPAQCQHAVADLVSMIASTTWRARLDRRWPRWPQAIDIYLDKVGGDILSAVLPCLNHNGRVRICRQISQYNRRESQGLRNANVLLEKCVKLQGFRSVATSHGGTRRWTSCWIGTGPAGSNSTRCRARLGGGTGGAHQHAVGRQYRQAGGAPDRSDQMSLFRRRRVGGRAKCKW